MAFAFGLAVRVSADIRTLEFPTNQNVYFSYALSGDGRWVAGGTSSRRFGGDTNTPVKTGEVVLWDAKTQKQRAVLGDHGATVNWMRFSQDGKTLVSASGSSALVKIWDVDSLRLRHSIQLEDPVLASSTLGSQILCALSQDGRRLATVGARIIPVGRNRTSEPSTLTLWDTVSGKALWSLTNCGVAAMAFTHDGERLVAYTRKVVWELVREVHSSRIEGEKLVCWNTADGQARFTNAIPGLNPSHLLIPDSGEEFLALGGDKNRWFRLSDGTPARDQILTLRQSLHVASLSPDVQRLFLIDFSAERFHMAYLTNGAVRPVANLAGYTNRILFVSVSPDMKLLAGTRNNRPVLMDIVDPAIAAMALPALPQAAAATNAPASANPPPVPSKPGSSVR